MRDVLNPFLTGEVLLRACEDVDRVVGEERIGV